MQCPTVQEAIDRFPINQGPQIYQKFIKDNDHSLTGKRQLAATQYLSHWSFKGGRGGNYNYCYCAYCWDHTYG